MLHPRRSTLLRTLLVLPAVVLFIGGCDNSFSPKMEYTERLVVFAVLDRSSSEQLVRLETTYDAEGSTPDVPIGKRTIDSARVVIADDVRAWRLTDTLVTAGDGSRKRVWIARNFQPVEARSYRLIVEVPGMPAVNATVFVPSRAYVQLVSPQLSQSKRGVEVMSSVTSQVAPPKGYYFRLWVVGKRTVGGSDVEVRREVPVRYDENGNPVYSAPGRVPVAVFPVDAVTRVKAQLEGGDGAVNLQLVATGYTMDAWLYNYFQVVRGFDDPVSVRQDRPDVTNIRGGVGVFGALVADSVRAAYAAIITER